MGTDYQVAMGVTVKSGMGQMNVKHQMREFQVTLIVPGRILQAGFPSPLLLLSKQFYWV